MNWFIHNNDGYKNEKLSLFILFNFLYYLLKRLATFSFFFLTMTDCGGALKKNAVIKNDQTETDLYNQFYKQQIVINDLSARVTQLENILLKQNYEIEKVKKMFEVSKLKSVELSNENEQLIKSELTVNNKEESSEYSIFVSNGISDDQERADKFKDLKEFSKNQGVRVNQPKPSGNSSGFEALFPEAVVASNYVPLKIPVNSSVLSKEQTQGESFGTVKEGNIDHYQLAIQKYNEGLWNDAVTHFDIFINKNPKNPDVANALFLKAESLFQAGKIIESLGIFEMVIERYPSFVRVPEAKLRIGRCREKMHDIEGAIKIYEEIVQMYPQSAFASKAIGYLQKIKNKN